MTGEAWTHTGYAQRLHFGAGVVARLPEIVKELGHPAGSASSRRPDGRESDDGGASPSSSDAPWPRVHRGALARARRRSCKRRCSRRARDAVDGVVSFGGGSCADLGKAVSYFTEQEAGTPGASYADRPALRHIAIPTTYSGAELTPFFGMTDERTHTKGGGGGPTSAPIAVVYDPLLTLSTPAR